jgi:hypothetical protein
VGKKSAPPFLRVRMKSTLAFFEFPGGRELL